MQGKSNENNQQQVVRQHPHDETFVASDLRGLRCCTFSPRRCPTALLELDVCTCFTCCSTTVCTPLQRNTALTSTSSGTVAEQSANVMLPCRLHCDLRATKPQRFNTSRVSAHLVPPARPPCCHWRHSAQHTPPLPRSRNAARDSIVLNASGKPNGNGSNGNGDRTGSSSGTNGSSLEGPQASASGNGGSNGGSIGGSSGGGKSGSNGPGQPFSDDGQNRNGQQSGGFRLPLSRQQLSYAVLGLAALAALMLVNLLRQATVVLALDAAMQTVLASLVSIASTCLHSCFVQLGQAISFS